MIGLALLVGMKDQDGSREMRREGKIVYQPPEKCYTRVLIESTEHGYKIYRDGDIKPFTVIPHSAVKEIQYKGGE